MFLTVLAALAVFFFGIPLVFKAARSKDFWFISLCVLGCLIILAIARG